MKFAALLFVLFNVFYTFSQDEVRKGVYRFTSNELEAFSLQTDTLGKNPEEIHSGHKIKVLYVSSKRDRVYYRYIPFNEKKTVYTDRTWGIKHGKTLENSKFAEKYNGNVYMLPYGSFNTLTAPVYSRYKGASMGIYTIPFRIRDAGGKYFDFETSLSLQSNLIFGWGSRKKETSWFDASCGIGITGVTIDSRNSNLADSIDSRTASAFTLSLGAVIKPSPSTSIGFFIGWDYLGRKDQNVDWVYHGKTWVGLGIGISLNPIKNEEPSERETHQVNR